MRPSQTILVLEDLRSSFSGHLVRKGVCLKRKDRETTMDVYLQWLCLMYDLGYLTSETLERDARRLMTDMVKADVLDLNGAFAELLQLVRVQDNKGFKVLCKRISGHLHSLVSEDMDRVLKGDVYAARRLVQVFAYTGRLTLHRIDLTQQCLEEYLRVEEGIPSEFPQALVQEMNRTIRTWVKDFDPANIRFQHGPGGVAGHGRTALENKYKDLSSDALLQYAFGEPWWVSSPIPSVMDRISQTIFVPKSYKTFRTISMECSTLMYCQQGVWGEIDRVVNASSFLRSRIGFHEQERNQALARRGSMDRSYATIDLSAASDSVSYALVKEVFKGTPLLKFLVATRSKRTILPDGRVIKLRKFAPMGSALCFPTETMIFAAICQCATRLHGVAGDYSVYGDDIIVPTQCAGTVIEYLTQLGFSVNREKSFYLPECWFRESCGAEFCAGFDVTPMRVSRRYENDQLLEKTSSLVDLANAAYEKGFRTLRAFFLKKMREIDWIPLFSPDGLLADSYTNYHTSKLWNSALFRVEVKVSNLTTIRKGKADEVIRYRHWLESTQGREAVRLSLNYPEVSFQSEVRRLPVKHEKTWMTQLPDSFDQDDAVKRPYVRAVSRLLLNRINDLKLV